MIASILPLSLALLAHARSAPADEHLAHLPPSPLMILNVSDVQDVLESGKESAWYAFGLDIVESLGGVDAELATGLEALGLPELGTLLGSFESFALFAGPSDEEMFGTAGAVLRATDAGGPAGDVYDTIVAAASAQGAVTRLDTDAVFDAFVVRPEGEAWTYDLFDSGEMLEMAIVRGGPLLAVFLADSEGGAEALARGAMAPDRSAVPPIFAAARDECGEAQLEFVLDIQRAMSISEPEAEDEFEELLLESVRSIPYMHVGFSIGKGESFEAAMNFPIGSDTILGEFLALAGDVPKDMFAMMPPGCDSVSAGTFDFIGAVDLVFDTMEELDPDGYEQVVVALTGMTETMGVNPIDDLVGLLDGRIGSFSMELPEVDEIDWDDPTSALGTTYIFGLEDGGQFSENFDTLLTASGATSMIEYDELDGFDLYDFGAVGVPLLIWITDEALVITFSEDDLEAVAEVLGDPEAPSALGDTAVKRALAAEDGLQGQLSVTSTASTLKMMLSLVQLIADEAGELDGVAALDASMIDERFDGTFVMVFEASSSGLSIRANGR